MLLAPIPILAIPEAIGLGPYLALAAVLFVSGLLTMMVKRNAIGILMGVELVLNAANVNLVACNHFVWSRAVMGVGTVGEGTLGEAASGANAGPRLDGQIFALFVIVLAASEAAVALAIFLNYYNNFSTIDVERGSQLKG